MGNRTRSSVAKQLVRAQLAIFGTLENPEILEAMTPKGYNLGAMQAAQVRFDAVQTRRGSTAVKRGSKARVNRKASTSEIVARAAFTDLGATIRAIHPSDLSARAALGLLPGNAPDSRAAFLAAAETLFSTALSAPVDLKASLTTYGYPEARLRTEQAKIAAFRAELTTQASAKGASEQDTDALHIALSDLNAWVMQYRKLARLALKDRPQLLEKIGISVKS